MIPTTLTHARRVMLGATSVAGALTLLHTLIFAPVDISPLVPLADKDGHFTIGTISHEDPKKEASWNEALQQSVETWNSSSELIHITIDPKSENTISFADLPKPSQAMYVPDASCVIASECTFTIYLDSVPHKYHPVVVKRRGQYLLTHELGHALGLNDRYREEAASIMSKTLRHSMQEPSQLDVSRVEQRLATLAFITGAAAR